MTEKNGFRSLAIGCSQKSFQLSAVSSQLKAVETAILESPRCRIVCDETEEEFRLTLCKVFCAGVCPRRKTEMNS